MAWHAFEQEDAGMKTYAHKCMQEMKAFYSKDIYMQSTLQKCYNQTERPR